MVQTPDCAVGRVGEGHEVNSPPTARVSPRESRTPSFGALLQHVKQRVSVFILEGSSLSWHSCLDAFELATKATHVVNKVRVLHDQDERSVPLPPFTDRNL